MKTIKHFALALVAVACGLGFTSCDQNKPDNYADYPQLIVGKWYSFSPEGSMFHNFDAEGNHLTVGYIDETLGWLDLFGKYRIEGNKLIDTYLDKNNSAAEVSNTIEVTKETLTYIGGTNSANPEIPGFVAYCK